MGGRNQILVAIVLAAPLTVHAQQAPLSPTLPLSTPTLSNPDDAATRPQFRFTPRGTLDFAYTDNVLVTTTDRKPDVIVSPSAGFSLDGKTSKTSVLANADAFYDKYVATKRLDGLRVVGRANSDIEIVEQLLSLSTRVATDQQRIDPFSGRPASPRSFGGNQTQVVSYGASPSVRWRFGNIADFDATYDLSAVNYLATANGSSTQLPSDSLQQSLRANLESGSLFDRFTWNATGYIQRQERAGPSEGSEQRQIQGSLLYDIRSNVRVVATTGYDDIRESTLPGVRGGLIATAGIRWSLSPRTRITFDAGQRYRSDYYNALITYSASRALVLRSSYTESVDTPQSLATQNLGGLITDPLGNLVDPISGQPADPNRDPFGLNNQAFLRKSFQVGITGTLGRNTYSLSGTSERRISNVVAKNISGNANVGRQISTQLNAGLTLGYDRLRGAVGGRSSETFSAGGALNYNLGQETTASLTYVFQRIRAFPTFSQENTVVLKLNRNF